MLAKFFKGYKKKFIEKGVGNYFSTLYEQWQNMAESSIKSIMLLAKTEMAESGLAGRFLYSATDFGRSCRNATYKQRLGTTPHAKIFGIKKDVSKFRPFGCRAYLHLNKKRPFNDVNLASMHQGQWRPFILDSHPT